MNFIQKKNKAGSERNITEQALIVWCYMWNHAYGFRGSEGRVDRKLIISRGSQVSVPIVPLYGKLGWLCRWLRYVH